MEHAVAARTIVACSRKKKKRTIIAWIDPWTWETEQKHWLDIACHDDVKKKEIACHVTVLASTSSIAACNCARVVLGVSACVGKNKQASAWSTLTRGWLGTRLMRVPVISRLI